jgi:hypothetical protein
MKRILKLYLNDMDMIEVQLVLSPTACQTNYIYHFIHGYTCVTELQWKMFENCTSFLIFLTIVDLFLENKLCEDLILLNQFETDRV